MKVDKLEEPIEIPDGVTISTGKGLIQVKGPKGEVSKDMFNPKIDFEVKDNQVVISALNATKREKTIIKTYTAHVKNLIEGVTKGFVYKLKICSGHFPMNVAVKGSEFVVKNFIGEAVPRVLKIPTEVKVQVTAPNVEVTGINKETVSQAAASIEQLTRRVGFDKRRFQDGIYITEKNGKAI